MKKFICLTILLTVLLLIGCSRPTKSDNGYNNAPSNLVSTYHLNTVTSLWEIDLVWDAPEKSDNDNFEYRVYKDEQFIIALDNMHNYYTDVDCEIGGEYTYYITAYYSTGESDPSNIVIVIIDTVPTPPSNPYPPSNTFVYTNIELSWVCFDDDGDSLTYDVYFGTKPNPSDDELVSSGQTSTSYNPGILNGETTYYWKIIAYDEHNNFATSDIWNFETYRFSEMIFVQGGTFDMGDHYDENYINNELPVHPVLLSDFFIGKYEITHAEYILFLNDLDVAINGSYNGIPLIDLDSEDCAIDNDGNSFYFSGSDLASDPSCPVIKIYWYGAALFCNWRSQQEDLTECYNLSDWSCDFNANGYRLPTEAEWEYAARGGVNWLDDFRYSGCHEEMYLTLYGWYSSNSCFHTHPVGTKIPNQLNIYDMSGNEMYLRHVGMRIFL